VVFVDLHLALIDETVDLVLHFLGGKAGPAGDILDRGVEGTEIGRALGAGLGFVEHQENVADAGHLVLNGQHHKPPFLGVDALNEGFKELHRDGRVAHHQNLEIRLVELESDDVVVGDRGGGAGRVLENGHLAEDFRGLEYVEVFLEAVYDLDQLDAA